MVSKPIFITEYYESVQPVVRNSPEHKQLALMAADEAMRVLPYFVQKNPNDDRPAVAINAIRDWANGDITLSTAETRKLSLDSHSAARGAITDKAKFAARAAGQAVATWHAPKHALVAQWYAEKVDKSD